MRQKRKIAIPIYNKHQGSNPRIKTWGDPAKTPLYKSFKNLCLLSHCIVILDFKVDGYETPVTLGQNTYVCFGFPDPT